LLCTQNKRSKRVLLQLFQDFKLSTQRWENSKKVRKCKVRFSWIVIQHFQQSSLLIVNDFHSWLSPIFIVDFLRLSKSFVIFIPSSSFLIVNDRHSRFSTIFICDFHLLPPCKSPLSYTLEEVSMSASSLNNSTPFKIRRQLRSVKTKLKFSLDWKDEKFKGHVQYETWL